MGSNLVEAAATTSGDQWVLVAFTVVWALVLGWADSSFNEGSKHRD